MYQDDWSDLARRMVQILVVLGESIKYFIYVLFHEIF